MELFLFSSPVFWLCKYRKYLCSIHLNFFPLNNHLNSVLPSLNSRHLCLHRSWRKKKRKNNKREKLNLTALLIFPSWCWSFGGSVTHKAVSDRQAFEQEVPSLSKGLKAVIWERKLHCQTCCLPISRLVGKPTL